MEIPKFWNRMLWTLALACSTAGSALGQDARSPTAASRSPATPPPAAQGAVHATSPGTAKAAAAGDAAAHGHLMLPRPDSLAALVAQSEREGRPVVALFSREGCGWCETIRRDQLRHLAREAQARGVLVVEFDVGDARAFRAAQGAGGDWASEASPAALARRLDIRATPTVVFLGRGGELAERLVGYGSPDFYGAYLDERITQARGALR